ncbi:hypothetical protein D3C76_1757780 [compost metagenome]
MLQNLQSVHSRDFHVEKNQVGAVAVDDIQCRFAVSRLKGCITFAVEHLHEQDSYPVLVIDD